MKIFKGGMFGGTPHRYYPSKAEREYCIKDEKGDIFISFGITQDKYREDAVCAILSYKKDRTGKSLKQLMNEQGVPYVDLTVNEMSVNAFSDNKEPSLEERLQSCEPGKLYYVHLEKLPEGYADLLVDMSNKGVYVVVETPDMNPVLYDNGYMRYMRDQRAAEYPSDEELIAPVNEFLTIIWRRYDGSEPCGFYVDRDATVAWFTLNDYAITLISTATEILISNKSSGKSLRDVLDEYDLSYVDLSSKDVVSELQKREEQQLYYLTEFNQDIADALVEKAKKGCLFVIESEDVCYIQNDYLSEHAVVFVDREYPCPTAKYSAESFNAPSSAESFSTAIGLCTSFF